MDTQITISISTCPAEKAACTRAQQSKKLIAGNPIKLFNIDAVAQVHKKSL